MRIFFFVLLLSAGRTNAQIDLTPQMTANILQGRQVGMLLSTILDGVNTYYPKRHKGFVGYFPVFENNRYKLVYFTDEPKLMAIGSVSFNQNYDTTSIEIDSTLRDLTSLEFETAVIQMIATDDLAADTNKTLIPESRLIAVPMISAFGRKVYIFNWPLNEADCHFGNDIEYSFASLIDEIISKRKIHKHLSRVGKNEPNAVHSHYGEDIADLPGHDIATFYFFADLQNRNKYVIADENKILELHLANGKVTLFSHQEYKKAGNKLPQFSQNNKRKVKDLQ
jgi:hypothetical protein